MLGAARTHQHNFPLFLAAVIGVSVLSAGVFLLTAQAGDEDSSIPP